MQEPKTSSQTAEFFRQIIENANDYAVFMTDAEGRISSWSPGAKKIFGYTENEIINQPLSVIYLSEDVSQNLPAREMEMAVQTGRCENTHWYRRQDGSSVWVNGIMLPLKNEDGTLHGFTGILRDETKLKLTEEKLEESSRRVENILSGISDSFFIFDREFRYIYVNEATTRMFDLPESAFLGKTLYDVFPDIEGNIFHSEIRRSFSERKPVVFENYYAPLDRWFENRSYPSPDGLSVFTAEITARKGVEEALRQSEAKYRTLFDSIDEGFCVIEVLFDENSSAVDYRYLEINPAFENLTGISAQEVQSGKTITELVPNIEDKFLRIYEKIIQTGEAIRFTEESKALNRWFDVYAFRVGSPKDNRIAVLFNNITEQKQSEEAQAKTRKQLEIERSRLTYIFERAPAFVAVLRGSEHVFELTNPAYLKLIGHRHLIGKKIREALPDVAGQGYFELLDKVYQTGEAFTGREQSVEFQFAPGSLPEKKYVDFVLQPIYEGDHKVSGIFMHGVDITEQVVARQAVDEANRLKDEFLATLSHELRTPLNAILGWSQILQGGGFNEKEAKDALAIIERSARSQSKLIDDILDVSRIIAGKLQLNVSAISLSNVITVAVNASQPAAEAKSIQLELHLDPQAGIVSGDSDRLQQVVWNLLSNAIKFTPKNGRVQVRLERVRSHLEITVSDTGSGIEPEFLPHVFDRFRQFDGSMTRRHGGLGLGLAIARQLVELHGGTISVCSDGENRGTTFTVSLPMPAVRAEQQQAKPSFLTAETRNFKNNSFELLGLHILIVDDEVHSRDLLKIILKSRGAEITDASSAAEAFEKLKHQKFDMLISDIGMPDEDGFSLIEKIRMLTREEGGNIPAIALTAYVNSEVRIRALRSGFQIHITKPVDEAELFAVVANLAERRAEQARNKDV